MQCGGNNEHRILRRTPRNWFKRERGTQRQSNGDARKRKEINTKIWGQCQQIWNRLPKVKKDYILTHLQSLFVFLNSNFPKIKFMDGQVDPNQLDKYNDPIQYNMEPSSRDVIQVFVRIVQRYCNQRVLELANYNYNLNTDQIAPRVPGRSRRMKDMVQNFYHNSHRNLWTHEAIMELENQVDEGLFFLKKNLDIFLRKR